MDEQAALATLTERLSAAGDDCAVLDGLVLTTDMLHAGSDFPAGTSHYTAGWRAVGASLSDVAAMGAKASAAVAVYGAPQFDPNELAAFVDGATAVCEAVDAAYVGGDLDATDELTIASTALGATDDPVMRTGAQPGETVCVTGTLGRSGAAVECFAAGDTDRANELFQFQPRVAAGRAIAPYASAMMDSSDGLARSLHHLGAAADCGFAIETPLPVDSAVDAVTDTAADRQELATTYGEDFELVCTLPEDDLAAAQAATPVSLTPIGQVTADGITLDGEPLPDRGWSH
jgi:thiamine-monophosphate kinase